MTWDKKARDYYFKNRKKLLPLKREWMRKFRAKNKEFESLSKGRCPECSMLLDSQYERWHKGCPYYETYIHTKIESNQGSVVELGQSNG